MKRATIGQKELIRAFVRFLNQHGYPSIEVDRWPDEENRSSKDIDAIAGNLAIEHTSIDTLENQRGHDDKYLRCIDGLEKQYSSLPYGLRVIVPYDAIHVGQDWDEIRELFSSFFSKCGNQLAPGWSKISSKESGLPFRIEVEKITDGFPGLRFLREMPDDESLPSRICELLKRKAEKLDSYTARDFTRILLLEWHDIALMDEGKLRVAIRVAFPDGLPVGADRMWLADTCNAKKPRFTEYTI